MTDSTGPARLVAALQRRLIRRVRALYYAVGFSRAFPGKAPVERWLAAWEVKDQRGDVPKDKSRWDEQYEAVGWDYLRDVGEVAHYAVIVGYGQFFKPDATVLDVGCGAGVLHERWLAGGYRHYIGVDISEVAVKEAQEAGHPDAAFVAANAEEYDPGERFDLVVFNESITYFDEPLIGFERYRSFLEPGGMMIVSCHEQSVRAQAILRELMEQHPVLDSTLVRQGDTGWRVTVLQPSPT